MKKLTYLKLCIICLYLFFLLLVGLAGTFGSDAIMISALMAFTAAAALTTYYIVLTQP